MKISDTKILVQGALFVAIYCVFFLVAKFFGGVLESSLFFMLPIPLAIFSKKYGLKKAFIPFVAIIILGFLFNPVSTLFYVVTANILGIVYGQLIRKDVKESVIIIVCAIASMITSTLTMVIFANLFEYDIMVEIEQILAWLFKIVKVSGDEAYLHLIARKSLPAFIFFMGLVEGFLTHISCLYIMRRLKETERKLINFYFITIPQWFAFVYIPVIVAYFILVPHIGDGGALGIISSIVFSLFYCGGLIFFLQGYLSAILFVKRRGKNAIIGYFMVLLALIIINFVYAIGFVTLIGVSFVVSDYHEKILYNK